MVEVLVGGGVGGRGGGKKGDGVSTCQVLYDGPTSDAFSGRREFYH